MRSNVLLPKKPRARLFRAPRLNIAGEKDVGGRINPATGYISLATDEKELPARHFAAVTMISTKTSGRARSARTAGPGRRVLRIDPFVPHRIHVAEHRHVLDPQIGVKRFDCWSRPPADRRRCVEDLLGLALDVLAGVRRGQAAQIDRVARTTQRLIRGPGGWVMSVRRISAMVFLPRSDAMMRRLSLGAVRSNLAPRLNLHEIASALVSASQ